MNVYKYYVNIKYNNIKYILYISIVSDEDMLRISMTCFYAMQMYPGAELF